MFNQCAATGWKIRLYRQKFSNKSTSFIVGEVITEATSGNTGIIQSDDGTTIYVKNVTGTGFWTNDREITGSTSGCTADVDEGGGSSKNQDTNVLHNLGMPLNMLHMKYISSTDKSANIKLISWADHDGSYEHNVAPWYVDSNNIKMQSAQDFGMVTLDDNGQTDEWTNDDYYYRFTIEVKI